VVCAHPDDVDFGAAGTVATWVAAGTTVSYCIITDGEAGGNDRRVERDAMAATRRDEQRAAAEQVGVEEIVFLGYPDGRVLPSIELRRDITREIRRCRPQRVLTQSPERVWDRIFVSHPDHLAVGESTVAAIYPDARNPFAHPELLADEGLEPHLVEQLWLMAAPAPNQVVDVTGVFDRKLAALRCHRSQVGEGAELDTRLRGWLGDNARQAGLDAGCLAESFRVVHTA
jgi:LmbE family N-acetylglucosaminyl deacetylase